MYILHVFVLYLFSKTNVNNQVPSSKWNVYYPSNCTVLFTSLQEQLMRWLTSSFTAYSIREVVKIQSNNVYKLFMIQFKEQSQLCIWIITCSKRKRERCLVTKVIETDLCCVSSILIINCIHVGSAVSWCVPI